MTISAVNTEEEAKSFLEGHGFCLLFPVKGLSLPSLWGAVKGHQGAVDWDEDAVRIWNWKDIFPLRGIAWYGKLLKSKGTFVAQGALPLLFAAAGRRPGIREYDRLYREGAISQLARDVAARIEAKGPTAASVLRAELGGRGKARAPVDRALIELQRLLLLTHFGTEERASGWPSAVLELTARAFSAGLETAQERDRQAARALVLGMLRRHASVLTDREATRLMGWQNGSNPVRL
jgi:hypothetical protein